jgi:hypothetical protein
VLAGGLEWAEPTDLGDLLFYAGWWDDAFVERLLERARSAAGGL